MGCAESKAAEPVLTVTEQAPAAEPTPVVVPATAPATVPAVEAAVEDKATVEPSQVVVETAAQETPAVVEPLAQAPTPEPEVEAEPEAPTSPAAPVVETVAEPATSPALPPPPPPLPPPPPPVEAEPLTNADLAIEAGEASTPAAGAGLRASLRESSMYSMLKTIGSSLKEMVVGAAEEAEPEPEASPEAQEEAIVKLQATVNQECTKCKPHPTTWLSAPVSRSWFLPPPSLPDACCSCHSEHPSHPMHPIPCNHMF